jgi:hypothetical protein
MTWMQSMFFGADLMGGLRKNQHLHHFAAWGCLSFF